MNFEHIITIETLLKLLGRLNDKTILADSVSGGRTKKMHLLTASEGYYLFDFLMVELQKKSLIGRIVSASHKIGIATTPAPESANNIAIVNSFIMAVKWGKAEMHLLELSEVKAIASRMEILIQYCEEYKIPKTETYKYVDESWEVMYGKNETESLLQQLEMPVQPATRQRAAKRK